MASLGAPEEATACLGLLGSSQGGSGLLGGFQGGRLLGSSQGGSGFHGSPKLPKRLSLIFAALMEGRAQNNIYKHMCFPVRCVSAFLFAKATWWLKGLGGLFVCKHGCELSQYGFSRLWEPRESVKASKEAAAPPVAPREAPASLGGS